MSTYEDYLYLFFPIWTFSLTKARGATMTVAPPPPASAPAISTVSDQWNNCLNLIDLLKCVNWVRYLSSDLK